MTLRSFLSSVVGISSRVPQICYFSRGGGDEGGSGGGGGSGNGVKGGVGGGGSHDGRVVVVATRG
jgi:hypothetical protein